MINEKSENFKRIGFITDVLCGVGGSRAGCSSIVPMWKNVIAYFLLFIGVVEILLAFNGRLRDAVMSNSPVRTKGGAPVVFLLAGLSAIGLGLGILLFGLWD